MQVLFNYLIQLIDILTRIWYTKKDLIKLFKKRMKGNYI